MAYLIGVPSLRLKGHYLAMATLAFGEIVNIFLNAAVDLTGGPSGFGEIPRIQIGSLVLDSDMKYYYFVWIVFIMIFMLTNNLINSRVGRALRSIHGSELAATAMGVNTAQLKVQVFILSALVASVSGSLYVHFVTFISPTTCNIMFSILLVMMVVVGGMANVWGCILGAALLTILPEYLRVFEDYDVIVYGFILLFIIMFLPGGLSQGFAMAYSTIRRGRSKAYRNRERHYLRVIKYTQGIWRGRGAGQPHLSHCAQCHNSDYRPQRGGENHAFECGERHACA